MLLVVRETKRILQVSCCVLSRLGIWCARFDNITFLLRDELSVLTYLISVTVFLLWTLSAACMFHLQDAASRVPVVIITPGFMGCGICRCIRTVSRRVGHNFLLRGVAVIRHWQSGSVSVLYKV